MIPGPHIISPALPFFSDGIKGTLVSASWKSPGNAMLSSEREKETPYDTHLCLDGVLSLGEVRLLLLGLLGHERRLVLGESSADGAGLLGAEVERSVPSTDMLGAWFEGNLREKKVGLREIRTSCPCRRA